MIVFVTLLDACGRVSLGSQLDGETFADGPAAPGSSAERDAGRDRDRPGVGSADAAPSEQAADAATALDGPLFGIEPASCRRTLPRCGVGGSEDCCASPLVSGGTFAFVADSIGTTVSVTLSNYRLDAFEVSVGRAREFIADFDAWRGSGEPLPGAGSHPRVADSGWQEEFTVQLPATGAELAERWTTCSFGGLVATDASGPRSTFAAASEGAASERVPLNCVTWYEAFAFCTWDGGRLPTLAELEYAGFGGDEQRTYPWGDAPPPNSERASFGCGDPPTERPECAAAPSAEVGTRPRGVGRFGQYDLAGSMSEWALDGVPTIAEPCTDCASLIDVSSRSRHGGSWVDGPEALENGEFVVQPPAVPVPLNGIRCARSE